MEAMHVPMEDDKGYLVRIRFQEFLETYQKNHGEEINMEELTQQMLLDNYMLQIVNMIHWNKSTVFVDFEHLKEADAELAEAIELDYYRFEPYLRHAVRNIIEKENKNYVMDVDRGQREFFVAFYNLPKIEKVRMIRTSKIGRLIAIGGTVTRTSDSRPELFYGHFICTKCGADHPSVEQQFQYTEPPVCKNPQCTAHNFQLIMDKSLFVDWQKLKVQENADEIPAGNIPRVLEVICRNDIVEVAKAGDKIVITGTVAVIPDTSGLARAGDTVTSSKRSGGDGGDGIQGLKQLGVKEMTFKMIFIASSIQLADQRTGKPKTNQVIPYFNDVNGDLEGLNTLNNDIETPQLTSEDCNFALKMSETPNLYKHMAESLCPSVFGHLEVKRGILLMLLGGVHKKTVEGISLRGDLNVCIVGDPSCAKSQFLKYVHGFLPRTIYTSGKSSSAAGLTASVVRDADTGDFCVEAGALMLADNGICCIDEFDKMDDADQVAIHEAMEQQTISITKAGIQATLNARTSILAAANPVFGRYDKTKTLKANIAISAAIMSRFDLFFIILDECERSSDEKIAKHIVAIHKPKGMAQVNTEAKFSREQLQRYISVARTINPAFSEQTRKTLVECYRLLRQNDILGKNKTAYRITVRQLESLIRLSEALARLHLNKFVEESYVKEAFRLLQKSIIFVESEAVQLEEDEENEEMQLEAASFDLDHRHHHGGEPTGLMDLGGNSEILQDITNRAMEGTRSAEMMMGDNQIPEQPTVAASTAIATKKSKSKTQISAKEYDEITNLLAFRLKQLEEEQADNFEGCLWKDLTDWYMNEHAKELTDISDIEQKKKTINKVIRNMIKHEGNIVVISRNPDENLEQLANDQKLLKLHPSYQM